VLRDKPSYNTDFPELAIDPIQGQEREQLAATGSVMAALHVNLEQASFHNADLLAADFTAATLTHAKFTADSALVPYILQAAYATKNLMSLRGANFACANLVGADFSGRMIFGFIFDDPVFGGYGRDEFFGADLRDANFLGSQFFVAVPEQMAPRNENSFRFGELSPVGQAMVSAPSDPVDYVGTKYVTWTFAISNETGFTIPLKSHYRRSLIMVLSSLASAKNLKNAKFPAAVITYIDQYKPILEKPVKTYDCEGQKSFNIDQMFHPDDVGPKNMQP
jgi:hypothetical protein